MTTGWDSFDEASCRVMDLSISDLGIRCMRDGEDQFNKEYCRILKPWRFFKGKRRAFIELSANTGGPDG